jgi:hypothetical protein
MKGTLEPEHVLLDQSEVLDGQEAKVGHREGVGPVVIGRISVAASDHEDEPGHDRSGDPEAVDQAESLGHGQHDGGSVVRGNDSRSELNKAVKYVVFQWYNDVPETCKSPDECPQSLLFPWPRSVCSPLHLSPGIIVLHYFISNLSYVSLL